MSDTNNSNIEFENVVAASQDEWAALHDQFPDLFGDPKSTVLYGIPESLIDAFEQEAPGLLSNRELQFERSLALALRRHYSVGFMARRLVRSGVLEVRTPMIVTQDDVEALGWKDFGLTVAQANKAAATIEGRTSLFREQLIAYAGWLVTNPEFQSEVAKLREMEGSFLTTTSVEVAVPFVEAMNSLCSRWQLCGMKSWDLPEPQGPNLANIESPAASQRGAETVTLQFPLTTKLPARFPIRELVAEMRNDVSHPHLHEWQNILDQESKTGQGLRRFSHMLHLQFFRNIVLHSRYPDRIAGNVSALDRAFGLYFDLGEDSVKKLRLEIRKRLAT